MKMSLYEKNLLMYLEAQLLNTEALTKQTQNSIERITVIIDDKKVKNEPYSIIHTNGYLELSEKIKEQSELLKNYWFRHFWLVGQINTIKALNK